jgi:hypothetical protein
MSARLIRQGKEINRDGQERQDESNAMILFFILPILFILFPFY